MGTAVLLAAAWSSGIAQNSVWRTAIPEQLALPDERRILPDKALHFRADTTALLVKLHSAPHERDVSPLQSTIELDLPAPDGTFETFRIVAYDMMEAPLQAQWTFAHTWRGVAKKDPTRTVRLDWTARGFHAMVLDGTDTWFMDPYYWNGRLYYQTYYKRDYPAPTEPFACNTEGHTDHDQEAESIDALAKAGDCQFRTYRLAQACTGEYTLFHGGTVPLAASAIVTTLNRVNGVYEKDLAIRLILVGNNNNLIYLDGATDPYVNDDTSAELNNNQANCDAVIGSANYDMGHLFIRTGGGLAQLQSPCTGSKARGLTGRSDPVGDPFDIDYVAHEMGHQFGGNHTQNNACNRSGAAMEPGSASTIMGYAGICAPNVQNASDAYFHGISIQEMSNYMESGGGNGCAVIISTANDNPTITPGLDYNIPAGTPFVLTASASDPNGHPITYCWEQYDNEVGTVMPPAGTNAEGPLFRSFFPTSSTQRYFPSLSSVISNTSPSWEVLPTVSRAMDFRVTVRDFNGTYGCTTEDNITLNVNGAAGPFLVSNPNTNIDWYATTNVLVQWSVAGTASAPISCSNVDILLSYDGGNTYPVTLLSNTPNDGSASVVVPSTTSNTARVLVRCANNVFYDISNTNFRILAATAPDFTFAYSSTTPSVCNNSSSGVEYTIQPAGIGGFTGELTLTAQSMPSGVSVNFSNNPVQANSPVVVTLSNLGNLSPGSYSVTVQAVGSVGTKTTTLPFSVVVPPAASSLSAPADGATGVSSLPTFTWGTVAGAVSYGIEIATDAGFNTIVYTQSAITGTTHTPASGLLGNTDYFWRVITYNAACTMPSAARSFETEGCYVYTSANVPVVISDGAPADYTSTIQVPNSGTITDVDVLGVQVQHSYIGDMRVQLRSPTGTLRTLVEYICGGQDNLSLTFNDEAAAAINCPSNTGATVQPVQTLSSFDGQEMNGTWTLEFRDDADVDGGSLNAWGIKVCTSNFSFLPVTWLSFTAKATDKAIRLDWQTAQEINNTGFEIERKADGERTFTNIGWVPAATGARDAYDYAFIDETARPGTTYYYRLRQIDFSGEFAYSDLRTARLAADKPFAKLFPNPAAGSTQLQLWGIDDTANAALIGMDGRVLRTFALPSGTSHNLDLVGIPTGVYWLRLQSGTWDAVEKLVISDGK